MPNRYSVNCYHSSIRFIARQRSINWKQTWGTHIFRMASICWIRITCSSLVCVGKLQLYRHQLARVGVCNCCWLFTCSRVCQPSIADCGKLVSTPLQCLASERHGSCHRQQGNGAMIQFLRICLLFLGNQAPIAEGWLIQQHKLVRKQRLASCCIL